MRVIDTRTGGYDSARERQEATGQRIADEAEPGYKSPAQAATEAAIERAKHALDQAT